MLVCEVRVRVWGRDIAWWWDEEGVAHGSCLLPTAPAVRRSLVKRGLGFALLHVEMEFVAASKVDAGNGRSDYRVDRRTMRGGIEGVDGDGEIVVIRRGVVGRWLGARGRLCQGRLVGRQLWYR